MSQKESIISGIFKYSISTWANLIIGFVSVLFTTRLLAPTEYGYMSMFFAASTGIMYVLALGFDGAYIRFYNEPPGSNTTNELLYKLIAYALIIGLPVTVISMLGFGSQLSKWIFGIESKAIIGTLFIYTVCQLILRYLNICYRMSFRVKEYTIQSVLMNCLARVLIIIGAFFLSTFVDIAYLLTIGIVIVLICYLFLQKRDIIPYNSQGIANWSISLKGYYEYVKYALYSAPATIVFYGNQYISQQIIIDETNAHSLGIFASAGIFGTILAGIKGGFSTYWVAYIFKNYKEEQEKIKMMHNYVLILSIILASLMVVFRDILYLFIGSEYHESKAFFSILLLQPLLLFVMETTDKGIHIVKKNKIELWANIITVITNIFLCFVLVRQLGIIGAAYANALSAILLFVIDTCYGQKYYITISKPLKTILGLSLLTFVLLMPSIDLNIFHILLYTIAINILAMILYYEEYKYGLHVVCQYVRFMLNKE